MALKTFGASNLFNEFTLFHPEQPLTALAGQPDLREVGAAWVLWNSATSNQIVRVKNIKVINQMSQNVDPGATATGIGTSKLGVKFIDTYTEGAMTATAASITPMDSNNTALPSQVKILTRLDSVATGTILKQTMNMASNLNTRTIPLRCTKTYGKSSTNSHLDQTLICSPGYGESANIQHYVLNENQGIAISPVDIQSNIAFRFTITFRIGSQTWIAGETVRPYALMPPMIVFNGTGSGIVIHIVSISMYEIGEDNMTYFAAQRIEGVHPDLKGIDVTNTVLPFDSNDPLPSGIYMYEDCIVDIEGAKRGAIIANPSYRRQILPWIGVNPTVAVVRMYGQAASQDIIDSEIVIRPGEGLALLQKNNSGMGRYGTSVLFQTEAIPTGGGGTHSIASVG